MVGDGWRSSVKIYWVVITKIGVLSYYAQFAIGLISAETEIWTWKVPGLIWNSKVRAKLKNLNLRSEI